MAERKCFVPINMLAFFDCGRNIAADSALSSNEEVMKSNDIHCKQGGTANCRPCVAVRIVFLFIYKKEGTKDERIIKQSSTTNVFRLF